MTRSIPTAVAIVTAITCLALATGGAAAQVPDEFTNLKLLPKDISKRDLMGVMRKFAGDLGVRCSHCHVGPDNLQGMDFATDEKPAKNVARDMMKMVDAINGTHLSKIETGRTSRVEVKCQTCHHGLKVPRPIEDVLAARIEKDGIDSALAKYRELREEHHGDGAYDFSSGPLNGLAERLGGQNKLDEALALARMNVEFNPDHAYTRMMLGGIHAARGEKADAIAAFKKAIEIEPDNPWAKRQLAALEAEGE